MTLKRTLLHGYERLPAYLSLLRRGRLVDEVRQTRAYRAEQLQRLSDFQRACPEFEVVQDIRDRRTSGVQRATYDIAQFWYVSTAIARIRPGEIHDIGSHRSWLIGLAAGYTVHTLDVRPPTLAVETEMFHKGAAEQLPWADASVQCLTSICSLEHFGLGSYGDPFDPWADVRAITEMERVMKPGATLALTTLCTGRPRSFVRFNAGRVYAVPHLHQLFERFEPVDEAFYSMPRQRFVAANELQTSLAPAAWDVYFGTWRKPACAA